MFDTFTLVAPWLLTADELRIRTACDWARSNSVDTIDRSVNNARRLSPLRVTAFL
jgi:hypothetical protein